MKKIFVLCTLALLSCRNENAAETTKTMLDDSTKTTIEKIQQKDSPNSGGIDYDGDGKKETASVIITKKGEGNPIEDGTPDESR